MLLAKAIPLVVLAWLCLAATAVEGDDRPSLKSAVDLDRDVRPIFQ
jgi:hypothetical protein